MSDRKYRPEIDSLRAIAVMSVVLFHAVPQSLPGGYVGLDIFFVISGYLIGLTAPNVHIGLVTV
jgi:peptidoglycan/LPS O-acetylase OafA/YrhL